MSAKKNAPKAPKEKMLKVVFRCDEETLRDMERAQKRIGNRNLATTLCNLTQIINNLYDYQDQGWQFYGTKKGKKRFTFRLPGPNSPTLSKLEQKKAAAAQK